MEKCTNQVSADVASKWLSKLVENTDILITSFLPGMTQIHPSLAAAQIFPFQKSALSYHSCYRVHVSHYMVTRLQANSTFVFVPLF